MELAGRQATSKTSPSSRSRWYYYRACYGLRETSIRRASRAKLAVCRNDAGLVCPAATMIVSFSSHRKQRRRFRLGLPRFRWA